MKEAVLYQRLGSGDVRCALCAHRCVIHPGGRGTCGVRENRDGTLYSLVYGLAVAAAVDPIEKKPLYHYRPGTRAFSIATVGCNFRCDFCQNADISQASKAGAGSEDWRQWTQPLAPLTVVEMAVQRSCDSIAYTYTEPTVFFEYAHDTAVLATPRGIGNVFVTNGYMTPEALEAMGTDLHAANVDLKSFRDDYYRRLCGGRLQPVLDTIERMRRDGVWVEITTLLICGENDDDGELRDIARFLADVDPDMPWHISRFIPHYRMQDHPPTSVDAIHRAVEIGYCEGVRYVYAGNVPGDPYEHTRCPHCGELVVRRRGYQIESLLKGRRCSACGQELAFVVGSPTA